MLYLLLAILSSASMTLALRFFRSRDGNRYGIILGNYLTCILLALLLTPGDGSVLSGSGSTVGMGAVAGFFYVSALVLMQTSVQQNGAGLTSAFARLGLVISLLVSVLFFEERPAVLQFLGVGLVLAALVLINNEGTGSAKKGFWLLLLTLLCSGGADAMSKVFEELGNPAENTRFFFWLFVTALLLTVCLALWERKRTGKRLVLREFAAGAAVGVPNYFSSYLLLRSLQKLPAFLVFPVFSTGTILLVLAAGLLFFRERLTKRQCLGVGLILAALVLLNL
ncbi:MAG: EamA family transporter [Oscillospiraceae bacterium]|nr:EamA family transporter [Oscillospiraceae bacterium]